MWRGERRKGVGEGSGGEARKEVWVKKTKKGGGSVEGKEKVRRAGKRRTGEKDGKRRKEWRKKKWSRKERGERRRIRGGRKE